MASEDPVDAQKLLKIRLISPLLRAFKNGAYFQSHY